MIHEVFMPALSSTMTEGKIVSWQKSPGDRVGKGETVLIVESDKADMDVEAFYEGFLATIIVPEGGTAGVGQTIALIAETEAEIEEAKKQATATAPTPSPEATPTPSVGTPEPVAATVAIDSTPSRRNGRIVATPRARKLAKQLNVDLNNLQGSGPHGRIVAEDVEAATGRTQTPTVAPQPTVSPVAPPTPIATPAPAPVPLGEVVGMNTLQNAVVRNMLASLQVPTFHVGYTITTDNLDKLYKQVKSKGVTMTALLAKAVAVAIQKYPIVNASYVDSGIQYNKAINIAVAVAMPDGGLITPVLSNADQIDIYSLSRTWKDLVARARSKQLQPQEYSSGTFTLSNLGMFGVDRFDAILPPGQGSILAIGASRPTVVATDDGMMGIKPQMQVNITCDHRIIYGADAAAFLQYLAQLIETNPQSLTL
ncbi:MAG: dihydrolipoamide acetyltransferase family protein [Limnospira sp. PMC 1291.21]|uniref:Dihydrolipoamide acetyltransferase component of pyruvate dehydrogenase complex n=2 Tax=Limnospira TaxID=2596745 RepID=A0A9P1KHR5_9CYAN|nr:MULTISPECIES: dihydrolipoamide acetyltransferase family protein [Limnospira]AMW27323.1 branched-chain alpha-keto acid dehydrogenase subunit E2 [Arthrospira platensis YZ]EKD07701.1 catalytic domain of components of various dehydrogenase complex [Arthrospira platensis C1]MDY7054450.1 dihydrolipoamide acetyltransferase family protein [Limnospira fusiformis LS22]QJB25626.1 2-oxo acid dehydrogenase subunit E2 [Limnospira fusiformis SAG 85.79]EDZ95758.1 catalytic domain of components of various d